MEIYLLVHGQAESLNRAADPYTVALTAEGREQARRLAVACRGWGIQFLCASTMLRAQQTADAIHDALPDLVRWDLDELEDLTLDDLQGEPTAGQLVSTWTAAQRRLGYERLWIRLMAAWARIEIYARTYGLERIAILGHESTVALFLLRWLGLDWRALDQLGFALDPGATCKVILDGQEHVQIAWINHPV